MTEHHHIKRLYLSDTDKKLAGVCGGIAEYLGVDSVALRVAVLLVSVLTAIFPMLIFYVLASMVIPRRKASQEPHHIHTYN